MSIVIGVDESGKGDFFGPLVICALACETERLEQLAGFGARDSKLVADTVILRSDERLRKEFPHAVFIIPPHEYNERYAKIKNLNVLLADGHAAVIAQLVTQTGAEQAISDKFGKAEHLELALQRRNCPVKIQQIVRGEQLPVVAAASILARAAFVREMDRLSQTAGMTLPKGAGEIVDRAGREVVRRFGAPELHRLAKIHFRNYQRALQGS